MPPRPGTTFTLDGQRLMLTQMDTELNAAGGTTQTTYTFTTLGDAQFVTHETNEDVPEFHHRFIPTNQELTFQLNDVHINPTFLRETLNFGDGDTDGDDEVVEEEENEVTVADEEEEANTEEMPIETTTNAYTTAANTYTYRVPNYYANSICDSLQIGYQLTDDFKQALKPFIQEVVKELLENEGFIIGKLPEE